MDEKMTKFLRLIASANWRQPPPVWDDQFRKAMNDGLVTVGWGGIIELTNGGTGVAGQQMRNP